MLFFVVRRFFSNHAKALCQAVTADLVPDRVGNQEAAHSQEKGRSHSGSLRLVRQSFRSCDVKTALTRGPM